MATATFPDAMVPYFQQYVADQKATMIASLGDNPPQDQVDQINAIGLNQFLVGMLKKILIEWKAMKVAQELGDQVEPLEDGAEQALDDFKDVVGAL